MADNSMQVAVLLLHTILHVWKEYYSMCISDDSILNLLDHNHSGHYHNTIDGYDA